MRGTLQILFSLLLLARGLSSQTNPGPIIVEAKTTDALTGMPLGKATVTLAPDVFAGENHRPYAADSDAAGNIRFEGIEPGLYRLTIERSGYVHLQYGTRRSYGMGPVFRLVAGQKVTGLTLALTPTCSLSGRVLDSDGDPVSRVRVRAFRMDFRSGQWQTDNRGYANTDEAGRYQIANLAPGKYYVAASTLNYGTAVAPPLAATAPHREQPAFVETFYPQALEFASASPIALTPGRASLSAVIRLQKRALRHIHGQVLDHGGPVSDARISLVPQSNAGRELSNGNLSMAVNGRFGFGGVQPGRYNLIVTTLSNVTQTVAVEVGDQDLENLTINLFGPLTILGTAVTEGAAVPASPSGSPRITLGLREAKEGPVAVLTAPVGDDGALRFQRVNPARYWLTVNSGPPGIYVKSIHWGSQGLSHSMLLDLTAEPSASGALAVTLALDGASVDGTVIHQNLPRLAGIEASAPKSLVVLVPETLAGDEPPHVSAVDSRGHFSLKGIRPGVYQLYAWESIDSGAWSNPEIMSYVRDRGTKLTLAPGSRETVSPALITAEEMAGMLAKVAR